MPFGKPLSASAAAVSAASVLLVIGASACGSAATSSGPATPPIGPPKIGSSIPNSSASVGRLEDNSAYSWAISISLSLTMPSALGSTETLSLMPQTWVSL